MRSIYSALLLNRDALTDPLVILSVGDDINESVRAVFEQHGLDYDESFNWSGAVRKMAYQVFGSWQHLDDAFMVAIEHLMDNIDAYDESKGSIESFAYTVMYNTMRNYKRDIARGGGSYEVQFDDSDIEDEGMRSGAPRIEDVTYDDGDYDVSSLEFTDKLRDAVYAKGDIYGEVFDMLLNGATNREIAKYLEVSDARSSQMIRSLRQSVLRFIKRVGDTELIMTLRNEMEALL